MIKDILTGLNAYVYGRGYMGRVAELVLPKLTPKMREYTAGGLAATVDIPTGDIEKLESELSLTGVDQDVISLFGVVMGNNIPLVFRGTTQSEDGTTGDVRVYQRGMIKELDWGTWKPGEDSNLKIGLTLQYYRYEYNGKVLIEADPINYKLVVNGVDQLAKMRDALGI